MTMEENEKTAALEAADPDEEVLFETILAEVKASNSKDRTRSLIDAINDDIRELMQSVNKYGKDGKITITLKFKCVQANEMNISAELETKKPKGVAAGTQMFRDLKGRLYMDDPNQMKLFATDNVRKIKTDN